MATEPRIIVREEQVSIAENATGNVMRSSDYAVIGAFNSEITDLTLVRNAREAHTLFGNTATVGDFKGTDVIDNLFRGVSTLLVANITTWSDDDTPVAQTTLTTEKLEAALNKLHNERFDTLFIAEELTDAQQAIVSAWLDAEFEAKYCHGQIAQLSKSTAAAYAASVGQFNNNVYYINTQQFTALGVTMDLNMSTAYIAGIIAGLDVDRSLTNKIIDGVTSVSPEYSTAPGEMGATLLNLNIPFLKCRNRRLQTYYCANSTLPDELDLYINRTRDSILNDLAVEAYLGEKNNPATENGVTTLIEGLKKTYIDDLKLISDLTYHTNKTSSKCFDLTIDEMLFDDIIDTINVTYSIGVQ